MRSKRKISLTVDRGTYDVFRSYCYENGMKVSTKVEQLIKELMSKKM